LAPAHTNPVELNNFAFASIVVGRCAEAVGWCNLALDRVQTAVEEGAPYAKYLQSERNAILLTRFFAELQLRDEAAYVKTLSEIDLQGAWNGRELAAVCALTNHALWLDEPERFAAIRPVLSKWIEAESSADVLEAIGACHALFAPWNPGEAWRTEWDRVRQVPEVFRGLPRTNCAESAPVVRTDRSMPFGIAATWGLLLVALGAAFFLVALWRRHRRVVALDALTAPAWEERVEAALLGGKPLSRMERLEALRSVRNLAHQDWQLDQIRSAQIQHWPELEQNVARHLADGEHTKAIAQRLDISVAMVYKTRHAIRNRLDLQPNDSLRKRLQELLHVILLVGTLTGNTIAQDAVITAIHDNDSAQWLAAMMELRQLEKASLPAPFDAALLPMEQRPDWAQVPDSMWWIWFKTAAAPLEVALAEEAPHDLLLTPSGEASDAYFERHSLLKSEHTPFLAALLLLLLGGIAGLSIRMRRLNLRPEQSHWMAIAAGLKEPSAREEAIRTWKAFKAKQPQPAVSEDFWGVLTSTEQEVAQFLAQDWTAAQIAKHFSCSPGNVYNLRSSIRRKWSLDATDDLVRFIQALQAENE
jgi:DNA-binding NarL/FixJ family response regulator